MTQEAQEWEDELTELLDDSMDYDWTTRKAARHLIANGVVRIELGHQDRAAIERLERCTWDGRSLPTKGDIKTLLNAIALIRERVVLKGEG